VLTGHKNAWTDACHEGSSTEIAPPREHQDAERRF
jgi:hypothetical protein